MKIGDLDISQFMVGDSECVIYLGDVKLYPSDTPPPTPTFDGKFLLRYNDGTSYTAECDSSSAVTSAQTSGGTSLFSAVTEVVVGDCVTKIDSNAFSNFVDNILYDNSISAITIGNNVTRIEKFAFMGAGYNGTSQPFALNIPSSVTYIGQDAFNSSNVSSVTFNTTTMNGGIFRSAFMSCKNLKTVNNIPHGALKNSSCCQFASNTSLTDVTFNQTDAGDNDISLSKQAFNGCRALSSVTLPHTEGEHRSSIRDDAFQNCTSLKSIVIPHGYGTIGGSAFNGCTSLTSITIPSSVTRIENFAFYNCTSLSSITIPSSVTSIGGSAFEGCTALTSVTFENAAFEGGDATILTLGNKIYNNPNVPMPYTMALGVDSNGNVNINPRYDSFGTTPDLYSINVTNYDSLGVSDWASIYKYYGWRYIIDTLHYLSMPYQFTLEQSSTYTETLCKEGNLYGLYPTEIKYNGTSYGYLLDDYGELVFTEVLLEEGASECASSEKVFSAPDLWAEIGNAASDTFSNGGVTVMANSDWRLTGTTNVANCRISGTSDSSFTASTDDERTFENVTIVCHTSTARDDITDSTSYDIRDNYTMTRGNCSINGSTRYWIRYKLNEGSTAQTQFVCTDSYRPIIIYIAFNVDDNWTDVLPPES